MEREASPNETWSRGGILQKKPNIVLITVDLMRPAFLDCYSQTGFLLPNIATLARQGVLFENAYAQTERTSPSHLCIFTSHYLSDCYAARLAPKTLPEVLHENGYETTSIPSSGLLSSTRPDPLFNFHRGFDRVYSVPSSGDTQRTFVKRDGSETLRLARLFLRQHRLGGSPWFLFLNFRDLHPPLPPDSSDAEHGPFYRPLVRVDGYIGEVMAELQALHLADETAIVLMSSHGCDDERNARSVAELREKTLRVALIMRFPAGPSGVRERHPVATIDVAPTLIKRCLPSVLMDSAGSADMLHTSSRRIVFAQTERLEGHMATDGRWKYVEYTRPYVECPEALRSFTPPTRLIDLSKADPDEADNQVTLHPEIAAYLRKSIIDRFGPSAVNRDVRMEDAVEESTQHELKTLDYW